MLLVVLLLKPFLYIGALVLGQYALRSHGRQWGKTDPMGWLVLALVGGLRFALGIGGFLAAAIWVNAQFGSDSDSPVLHWPAATVLGPIGLLLWFGVAALAFWRAPWWKWLAFACAAEVLSSVLDLMNGFGEGTFTIIRLSDLILSGRGLGGC
jgi:uncharacterized membrane protein YdcZ (DUF606 family)